MLVQVINGAEHLSDRLGSIFLGELSLFADAVEELSASSQLSHNVVLVLQACMSIYGLHVELEVDSPWTRTTHGT